jgi:hypothetical protein
VAHDTPAASQRIDIVESSSRGVATLVWSPASASSSPRGKADPCPPRYAPLARRAVPRATGDTVAHGCQVSSRRMPLTSPEPCAGTEAVSIRLELPVYA